MRPLLSIDRSLDIYFYRSLYLYLFILIYISISIHAQSMSSWLIWVEYRRRLATSTFVLCFYAVRWALCSKTFFTGPTADFTGTALDTRPGINRLFLRGLSYMSLTAVALSSFLSPRPPMTTTMMMMMMMISPEVLALHSTRRAQDYLSTAAGTPSFSSL